MTTTNTIGTFQTKALEILDNFIKTNKIFTAYHITTILRECGYSVNHHDIRDIIRGYDMGSKGYSRTLSTTLFKVAVNIYHPLASTTQDIIDFENAIQNAGDNNSAIVTPSLNIQTTPALVNQVTTVAPATPAKTPVSSIRLKSDTVQIKADKRGRVCLPAEVVRKYFKAGDKVGIRSSAVNLSIEPFAIGGKYSSVMTVDSYDNIRINSKHMHKSSGSIVVNFNDNAKTIVLV